MQTQSLQLTHSLNIQTYFRYRLLFEKPSIDLVFPLALRSLSLSQTKFINKGLFTNTSLISSSLTSLCHILIESPHNGATKKSTENVPTKLTNNPILVKSNATCLFPHLGYFSTVLRLTLTSSLFSSSFCDFCFSSYHSAQSFLNSCLVLLQGIDLLLPQKRSKGGKTRKHTLFCMHFKIDL